MLKLSEYLADPCGALSIPYWKAKAVRVPDNMRIVHERDFSAEMLRDYEDSVYFRLRHDLKHIPFDGMDGVELRTAEMEDMDELARVINESYEDISVTREQLLDYTKTPVYAPELWILAVDKSSGETLGSGIADFDAGAGELILEWIQVLPAHRGRGVGKAIVHELLCRRPKGAAFATVSGREADAERLYRACGFAGGERWHILHLKE